MSLKWAELSSEERSELVARVVLGWRWMRYSKHKGEIGLVEWWEIFTDENKSYYFDVEKSEKWDIPNTVPDLLHLTHETIEALQSEGYAVTVRFVPPTSSVQQGVVVLIVKDVYPADEVARDEGEHSPVFVGRGDTFEDAVCIAALKVKGVDIE